MESIADLKARVDLGAVFEQYGVSLEARAGQLWGCCPLHQEKTPSLAIHPARQVWHCHGCHEGGDVITLIQRMEDIDVKGALRTLRRLSRGLPPPNTRPVERERSGEPRGDDIVAERAVRRRAFSAAGGIGADHRRPDEAGCRLWPHRDRGRVGRTGRGLPAAGPGRGRRRRVLELPRHARLRGLAERRALRTSAHEARVGDAPPTTSLRRWRRGRPLGWGAGVGAATPAAPPRGPATTEGMRAGSRAPGGSTL